MSVPPKRKIRKKRDPGGTRDAILQAARKILALGGKEGLSVAQVAQRAGVNRGTAYQHFQTRAQLIEATAAWVSDELHRAVFGPMEAAGQRSVADIDPKAITEHLAAFAMENPELGRIWLFELLSSQRPANDPFWQRYRANFEAFAKTELAQPNIDTEVTSVLTLAGVFLWPVWARSHARSATERRELAQRCSGEVLRLCLYGTLRPEEFRELVEHVGR